MNKQIRTDKSTTSQRRGFASTFVRQTLWQLAQLKYFFYKHIYKNLKKGRICLTPISIFSGFTTILDIFRLEIDTEVKCL